MLENVPLLCGRKNAKFFAALRRKPLDPGYLATVFWFLLEVEIASLAVQPRLAVNGTYCVRWKAAWQNPVNDGTGLLAGF